MPSEVRGLLDKLKDDIEFQRGRTEAKSRHSEERRASLAQMNRRAWVYGLHGDGNVRYIGVSFYPEYQATQVLSNRQDSLGEWIREHKPQLILLEQVDKADMSARVNLWQRRFKGVLLKKTRKTAPTSIEGMTRDELLARLEEQIGRPVNA